MPVSRLSSATSVTGHLAVVLLLSYPIGGTLAEEPATRPTGEPIDGGHFREVKEQTEMANEPIEWGSLRLDGNGGVLVDVPAQPGQKLPHRTFRWDATAETISVPKQVAIPVTHDSP